MTGWVFDASRFVEEVLKPVQDGWRPEQDLFRVYLLSVDVADPKAITAALDEVNKQFAKQQYRTFRRACDLLRAQHKASAKLLTDPVAREKHREEVVRRYGALADTVRHRLHGAPALPAAEVAALVKDSKGVLTKTSVREALRRLGVAEQEPVSLPATPLPAQWSQVRGPLAQLRRQSVWDYLTGTTELAGQATTARQLAMRHEALRKTRNADTEAEASLLQFVEKWLSTNGLAAVLRHELISELAGQVTFGYGEVLRVASESAERLAALGLPADHQAVAYAVWCGRVSGAADLAPPWIEEYQHANQDGRLHDALRILTGQPGLDQEWIAQRTALKERLAGFDREFDRCRALETGDVEAAVAAYHRLRSEVTDPRIDQAITRCRPTPPLGVVATVDGGRVVVTWKPSASATGRIGYRVTRDDTVVCEEIATCEVTDPDPPGGAHLVYAVHSLRDGNPSAAAASSSPVTLLREVTGLELTGGAEEISGRWRLPPGATDVEVSRCQGDSAETPLRGVDPTTFTDRTARAGENYEYRVRVRYRLADGSTALSYGARATARRQEVPEPVTDLRVEFDEDDIVAEWTAPARGEVQLLELPSGQDVPRRGVVPLVKAKRYGSQVAATGHRTRGHLRGRTRVSGKRHVLLPVTVLGELAAIGEPFELDARQSSVRNLVLRRLGSEVRLSWEWPAGATEVRVVWRTAVRPSGPADPEASFVDVTRVSYDSKGVTLPVLPGEHWFGVCTAVSDGGARRFGPLVLRSESTTNQARYRVQRRREGLRRLWELVVEGEGELPEVVVLARTGIRPGDAADGQVVLRMPAGTSPLRGEVLLPKEIRRPVYLRAFSTDDRFVLVPSRPDQLVVK